MKQWRYIEDNEVSADMGLATDEFLMRYFPAENPCSEPALRLYTYRSHCALVGRFQNIQAELNLDFCRINDIQIGRRPTGGGAIIMGGGQLGLCFVTSGAFEPEASRPADIYRRYSAPMIDALKNLGIEAGFRSKNDLEVNGKKIAGLGVYTDTHGAILFHTSLLVDLDVPLMLNALRIPVQKISDKAMIRSVGQRVTTVSRELNRSITTDEVRQAVKKSFEKYFGIQFRSQPVSNEEKAQIEQLANEKYRSDEWLFQRSPQADMTGMSIKKTPAGLLRTYIGLKGETIKSVLITGDFFEHAEAFAKIEARLKWAPLEKSFIETMVSEVFAASPVDENLTVNDLVGAIWLAAKSAMTENRFTYRGSCYYPKKKQVKAKVTDF